MAVELTQALDRLQEVSRQFERSIGALPDSLRPLITLIQTQTSIIEALIAINSSGTTKQPDRDPLRQHESNRDDEQDQWKFVEETTRTLYGPKLLWKQHSRQLSTQSERGILTKNASKVAEVTTQGTQNVHLHHRSPSAPNPLRIATPNSGALWSSEPTQKAVTSEAAAAKAQNAQCRAIDQGRKFPEQPIAVPPMPKSSPLTPERSWLRDPTPRISRIQPALPPPPTQLVNQVTRSRSNSNSSGSSAHSISTCKLCQACTDQDWKLQDRQPPWVADQNCEAHIHEATSALISAMKDRKRTPVGHLKGSFHLYSTEYRNHHCVHNNEDQQKLWVFSESIGWEDLARGIAPPNEKEIAMEVRIYPGCHLIVKPFEAPRIAGLKWHCLDAFDAQKLTDTRVDVMMLGNGFIKLKLRLSELLGEQKDGEQPNRFIEFCGVWENPRGSIHRIQNLHPTIEVKQEVEAVIVISEEDKDQKLSPSKKDSGFFSRCLSDITVQRLVTPITALDLDHEDMDKKLRQVWSPVSPL